MQSWEKAFAVLVTCLVFMVTEPNATAVEMPVIVGNKVERRDLRGQIAWEVVLPEEPRGLLQPVGLGWNVGDGLQIDRFGRAISQTRENAIPPSATVISNGAWSPVTVAATGQNPYALLEPIFTPDGDVVIVFADDVTGISAARSIGSTGAWEPSVPLQAGGFQGTLIADGFGNLMYVYRDFSDPISSYTLSAVRYTPEDGWLEPEVIVRVPTFFQTVTGAADADGNIVVAFGGFEGPVYSVVYRAATRTWSDLNVLAINGGLPTMAVSRNREHVVLAYARDLQELLVQTFDMQTGWAAPRSVPGSSRIKIYGSSYGRIPVMVDNAGNITTYWEARFGFLRKFYFTVYGAYLPRLGTEPAKRLLPWELGTNVTLYEFGDSGLSPDGSALAVVTRFAIPGVDFFSMYHDVNRGWTATQNPFSEQGDLRVRTRMAWRSDETALAVVLDNDAGNYTTLFFSDEAWENQQIPVPTGGDSISLELASDGLDIVDISPFATQINATWYQTPAESIQGRLSVPVVRRPKR